MFAWGRGFSKNTVELLELRLSELKPHDNLKKIWFPLILFFLMPTWMTANSNFETWKIEFVRFYNSS